MMPHFSPSSSQPECAVRAVFFDAAGTLFYLPNGVGYHYSLVARRFGVDIPEKALSSAFRNAWNAMPAPLSKRVARTDDDRGWWRELVFRVLAEAAPDARIEREGLFDELYNYFAKPGVWALFPEVIEVLSSLRGTYCLGIVSNFDSRLRAVLQDLEIAHFFQFLCISSEVGADKPDPYIFEHALGLAGVSEREAVHIGDDPHHDGEGAARAGIRCFLVDQPRRSLVDAEAWIRASQHKADA